MWKKTIDTPEIISYELVDKGLRSIIEARYNADDKCWDIFHTFFSKDNKNYTEAFTTTTKDEAEKLLAALQDKKLLSDKEVADLSIEHHRKINLEVKRLYKDYNVEKWAFFVNGESFENVIYIRDHEMLIVDIILYDSYKTKEAALLQALYKILGLYELDTDVKQTVFYYNRRKEDIIKNQNSFLFSKLNLGLDSEEED